MTLAQSRTPFLIEHWWTTIVFRCLCTPDPPVLALVGVTTEVVCPRCQRAYSLDEFAYHRREDRIAIALGERVENTPGRMPS